LEGLRITLYQYKICPFCCKVKAVLDYYKIPYETMDVNPLTKAEIKFSADYRKVPIARIGEEVVIDSSVIVGKIMELLRAAHVAPGKELDAFFSPEATRWAEWADMELAVLLFPNITRTFGESYQAFSYVRDVPHFSMLDKISNQWIGATAMWAAQGKIKKKYNITDERAALFAALEDWSSEVGDKPFLSGNTPNVGDLCVYACIRAIEGLDAHKDLLANTGIGPWYTRVEHAIGASSCVQAE
jgi:microsomal prostaglandin-E synthase 2